MGGIPKWARWDTSNLMGAKCPVRLCTGPRSLGKTYAMKKQGIKRYLEKGETIFDKLRALLTHQY